MLLVQNLSSFREGFTVNPCPVPPHPTPLAPSQQVCLPPRPAFQLWLFPKNKRQRLAFYSRHLLNLWMVAWIYFLIENTANSCWIYFIPSKRIQPQVRDNRVLPLALTFWEICWQSQELLFCLEAGMVWLLTYFFHLEDTTNLWPLLASAYCVQWQGCTYLSGEQAG